MDSSWSRRRLVLLILCVLQPMLLPVSHGCSAEERAALMEIRASLVRANSTVPPPPWGKRLSGHDDCCSWKRVRCSNVTRRVSQLDLYEVYGTPNSSGAWSLDTTIFAAFPELQFLDLSYNRPSLLSFDGFKNLSNLRELRLRSNNISGILPSFLFSLPHIELLDLSHNMIVSVEPISYPQTSLKSIDISMNHIVGKLPANISSVFPSLTDLDVSNNYFSGEIPMSLCHINHIVSVDLSNNNFSGVMPACVFTDLPNLVMLRVSNNRLGGPILGGRTNLSVGHSMFLDGNKFEGPPPRYLSGEITILDLRDNKLTGELDASSWNLSVLNFLDVSGNYLTGEIHPQICAIPGIGYLDLSNNHFTGRIRSCNSTSLVFLNVSMNSLSGDVSWEHFNASSLVILDARHNMLTGNLSWVHRLPLITVLSLGHNEFHGQIPPSLCELRYLRIIELSHNKLSGPVPPCVSAISFQDSFVRGTSTSPWTDFQLLIDFYTAFMQNDFTLSTKGMQLPYGSSLVLMSGIDLSGNSLSGAIPRELGELSHVKSLNLSRNALVGPIPASLANMSEVESLDLSHNELTGAIPLELTRLGSLEVFSVAYNRLSGCVPSSGQFGTFGADSYEGNSLEMECSSSPTGLEPGPVPPRDEMVVVDAGPYAASAASFVLAFWATVAFSFCHSTGRRMVLKL